MSDLPIKISSVSAKPAASKPAANAEASQQDAQEFGNVLARQVADSSKPAESASRSSAENSPSGDKTPQTAQQDGADASRAEDTGSALPADIMAALLAQQNPAAIAQSGTPAQADLQTQEEGNLKSVLDGAAAQGKQTGAALALLGGKADPANTPKSASDIALPQIINAGKPGKGLAESFKASVMKEINPAADSKALRAGASSDIASALLQPGSIPLAAGTSSSTSPVSIDSALNQPGWGDEFSQKITWMTTQRNQTAELHLNPPQLGPLDVVLKMNGDQANATFTSPHAAVREAIEQAIPKLREMLADSGIMLGNATVNDQAAKNEQNSSSRNPQTRSPNSAAVGAAEGASIQETRISPSRRHNGMVDTFA